MNLKILTFHRAVNYGAVLQAVALYKVISQKFPYVNVSIYDHYCKKIEDLYRFKPWRGKIKNSVSSLLTSYSRHIRRKRVHEFLYTFAKTEKNHGDSDCFIVGSDQVWNYNCTEFDKTFFLDFLKNRKNKNSYAASFGFDKIPPEYIDEYKRLLKDFNHISVREAAGANIIEELLNCHVPVVIDPTLLLKREEWADLQTRMEHKKPYILVYAFGMTKTMKSFIESLSKKEDLDIIVLMPNRTLKVHRWVKGAKYLPAASPEEWLSYFMDAEHIVTNSFHGTAFAINFNKSFFTELLPSTSKVNSRFHNILNLFDLQERLIVDGKNDNVHASIDYDKVNTILEQERLKALEFLRDIIEGHDE